MTIFRSPTATKPRAAPSGATSAATSPGLELFVHPTTKVLSRDSGFSTGRGALTNTAGSGSRTGTGSFAAPGS
jgi:hypothetical protein